MKKRDPSYLLLRNGVYYFHYRVPEHLRHRHGRRKFIRKSLHTSNRKQALQQVRSMWVILNQERTINMTTPNTSIEEIEAQIAMQASLYTRGKTLYEIYSELDPDNIDAQDAFFTEEFGAGGYKANFDADAFNHYQDIIQRKTRKVEDAVAKSVVQQPAQVVTTKESIRLSKLLNQFVFERSRKWSKATKKEYNSYYPLIIELLEDPVLDELNYDYITEKFSKYIERIPKNASKLPIFKKNKNSKERHALVKCIEIAEAKNLDIIAYSTQKKYITYLKSLLQYGINRELINKVSLTALEFFDYIDHDPVEKEGSYNQQELESIFYQDMFTQGLFHRRYTERHWLLLLALYTGARANELAQIKVADIKKHEDFYYLDVLDEERTKTLKTKVSRRVIPVHPNLIELGFIDFVEHQKERKQDKLFERLTPNSVDVYHRIR